MVGAVVVDFAVKQLLIDGSTSSSFRGSDQRKRSKLQVQYATWLEDTMQAALSLLISLMSRTFVKRRENTCNRGGYCNFMHLKRVGGELRYQLFGRLLIVEYCGLGLLGTYAINY
ncbi:hypothetical protein Droror1_Dr00027567 [Drosera rotundifolia]